MAGFAGQGAVSCAEQLEPCETSDFYFHRDFRSVPSISRSDGR